MTLPRPPAAVVFDMDGVLFDTETLYEQAALAAARELGFEMTTTFFRSTVGSPWNVNRARLLEEYGADLQVDHLNAVAGRLFDGLIENRSLLKPGAAELLNLLEERRLPRAIATSSSRATVERHLQSHSLGDHFHQIVARGDYEQHKPHPEPYLLAASKVGVAPERCVAIEDSYHGVRSASAAGMMTLMVPDLLPPTEEIAALCLRVVPDLHAVRHLIHSALQSA